MVLESTRFVTPKHLILSKNQVITQNRSIFLLLSKGQKCFVSKKGQSMKPKAKYIEIFPFQHVQRVIEDIH